MPYTYINHPEFLVKLEFNEMKLLTYNNVKHFWQQLRTRHKARAANMAYLRRRNAYL